MYLTIAPCSDHSLFAKKAVVARGPRIKTHQNLGRFRRGANTTAVHKAPIRDSPPSGEVSRITSSKTGDPNGPLCGFQQHASCFKEKHVGRSFSGKNLTKRQLREVTAVAKNRSQSSGDATGIGWRRFSSRYGDVHHLDVSQQPFRCFRSEMSQQPFSCLSAAAFLRCGLGFLMVDLKDAVTHPMYSYRYFCWKNLGFARTHALNCRYH